MNRDRSNQHGFSLIELLVVISIIAALIGLAVPNFLGIRERARDAKRKEEMSQLKSALRLYYNDYQKYPADNGGPPYDKINGCGLNGTTACSCSSSIAFAAGGSGCDVVYMKKFPSGFGTTMFYYRSASGDDFCLRVPLENASDGDIVASQARCATACGANISGNDYAVCAD